MEAELSRGIDTDVISLDPGLVELQSYSCLMDLKCLDFHSSKSSDYDSLKMFKVRVKLVCFWRVSVFPLWLAEL